MRRMLLLISVFAFLGGLLAAGYCAMATTSWQTFVSYNAPPGTPVTQEVSDTLERHIKSLPKGQTGHGITFLGMPIEEEYDWGSMKTKKYHGLPGGRWAFIALGSLMGGLFFVLLQSMFLRSKKPLAAAFTIQSV